MLGINGTLGIEGTLDINGTLGVKRVRGAVVEWLEQLGYGAESRRIACSRLGCAMRRLENSLCQPSRKWVPFSN